MRVNPNIIHSIHNNKLIPLPNITVQNIGGSSLENGDICGSWDFFGKDDEETYLKNVKEQPDSWYYRNNKIKYTLNSYGYRTKEFNHIEWQNSIVIFGCSYVFGTGVDDSHTIGSFLQDVSGVPVINLGMGGSSIQFALHNSLMLYKSFGIPKQVVYCFPGISRYMLYQRKHVELKMGSTDQKMMDHVIPFNIINVELIRNLWHNKCSYYECSFFPTTAEILGCDLYEPIPDDYARDLSHPGITSNKYLANKIYKHLKL